MNASLSPSTSTPFFMARDRVDAANQVMRAFGPYEGQRLADLPDAVREHLTVTWARCACWLESPARPVVKKGRIDLSWYHASKRRSV